MRTVLLTASLVLTLAVVPSHAAPRFPLGTYAGNPDGTTPANEAVFEAQFNSFVAGMGTRPTLMNAYADYTQDPSLWGQNAQWTAWSWSISPVVGTGVVPVVGVPLGVNWSWNDGGAFFRAIAGGTYDADYAAVIDGWSQYGYKSLYLRIGYEMNSTGVPWYAGSDSALNAEWIAAFDHVAAVMRAEAALDGVTVSIVWNPVSQNWTAMDVSTLYPGNANVDVVAVDVYSPVYPRDLTDWSQPCCVQAQSLQAWFKSNVNRQH